MIARTRHRTDIEMLRGKTLLIIALGSTMALGACARDTLVDGPYLVGKDPEPVRDGICSPADEVKQQDARRPDWIPCKKTADFPTEGAQVPVLMGVPPAVQMQELPTMKPAVPTQHRSAWD